MRTLRPTARKALVMVSVCLSACLGLSASQPETSAAQSPPKPNIIFILADDLDERSVRYMPNLKSQIARKGTTFENFFVTNSLCCPSRASILRGQYSHNHHILGNTLPSGGFKKFRRLGHERSTVATWLKSGHYRTALFGKYFNEYDAKHVPPGWSEWYGVTDGGYKDFALNENGKIISYGGAGNYQTDVLSRKASSFVRRSSQKRSPFFAYIAPKAPHDPATPAARHEERFSNVKLPKPPSFDEQDVSDKPEWVRDNRSLSAKKKKEMRNLYRNRLRSMLAVDEMIGRLVKTLKAEGELRNTYLFFTSDNGHHMGQHRLGMGKWTAYEEDINVPLIARGPGVPRDRVSNRLVLNNDFAPTFARLGRAETPPFIDGRSFASLLSGNQPPSWRSAFLVEAKSTPERPAYEAVRTGRHLYVEYKTGERELYDMREDPYQLQSIHDTADPALVASLQARLEALRNCARTECRDAENTPPAL